ncbi:MAG TPA: hypothetical protein VFH97_05945 [Gemmatimonadales bacterium]|nr:hypothetical protein [Gemmatimonadales bacterium]
MAPGRIQRCLEIFEDSCTVTAASVRGGLDVEVEVETPATARPPAAERLAEAV